MSMPGAGTDPYEGVEAWRFTGRGKLMIARFTGKYGEIEYMTVPAGKTFHLKPVERRYNSDLCYADEADPFKNGTCLPVAFAEETPAADRAAIETSSKIMSDDDIDVLLGKGTHTNKLPKILEEITNPIVLLRILERAEAQDVVSSKITHIRARLAQVDPTSLPPAAGDGPRPIMALATDSNEQMINQDRPQGVKGPDAAPDRTAEEIERELDRQLLAQ